MISANCDSHGNKESGDTKAGLVRRATNFPTLMLSLGFKPAFTFYISKIENYQNLVGAYKFLSGGDGAGKEAICNELGRGEGAGYAGYVAILLSVLTKIGKKIQLEEQSKEEQSKEEQSKEEQSKEEQSKEEQSKVYSMLLSLVSDMNFKDERRVLPYLIEIKKVMEALPL